jgi:hypothetical protein
LLKTFEITPSEGQEARFNSPFYPIIAPAFLVKRALPAHQSTPTTRRVERHVEILPQVNSGLAGNHTEAIAYGGMHEGSAN